MPRHGENIYKRKDNRWEGRYKVGINETGKPIYKSVYASSYLACKNKLKPFSPSTAMAERDLSVAAAGLPAFSDACQEWLLHIKPNVKDSTFTVYHYIVDRYINTYFSRKKIHEIDKEMADAFVNMLLKESHANSNQVLSVRTIGNILIVLKSIFAFIEMQFSIKNPTKNIKLPKQPKNDAAVLSQEEWDKLSNALVADQKSTATAIAVAMYTGVRIGELCALKKADIDFAEKVIYIKRTVQRIKNLDDDASAKTKLVIGEPKSTNASRKIPIPDILLRKLKTLCIGKSKDDFLWGIDEKNALEPRTLQYRFKAFLKKTGLRNINFHALRHTFATKCIEKHVDIKTLSEILGHANVKITLERYVHSSMEFKRSQINRLNDVG